MPFRDLREQILAPSLCTACGVCELACPERIVVFDELEPTLRPGASDADCGACTDCLEVCPGLDPATPTAERRTFGRTRTRDERWLGIYRRVYGARATDLEVFRRSASGGSATALLYAAVEHLELDYVLVMGRENARPWRSAPTLTPAGEDLANYAQSTYQLAPYLGALRPLYEERPDSRVGMVGLACHVQGMRKLQALDSPIGAWACDHVRFVIEIACSSATKPAGTESIIQEVLDLELAQVTRLKYREGDYPGQMMIEDTTGKHHELPFWKVVRHFASNKTHRCLSCGDWMSGLTDISISDGDPNIFDASLGVHAIDKHGRIFIRTEVGAAVHEYARAAGKLDSWPIDLTGMNLGLERKRNRRAAYEHGDAPIPLGPIPGYREDREVVADEEYLRTPEERARHDRTRDQIGDDK